MMPGRRSLWWKQEGSLKGCKRTGSVDEKVSAKSGQFRKRRAEMVMGKKRCRRVRFCDEESEGVKRARQSVDGDTLHQK